jgi:hypothetical protein
MPGSVDEFCGCPGGMMKEMVHGGRSKGCLLRIVRPRWSRGGCMRDIAEPLSNSAENGARSRAEYWKCE